MRILEQDFIQQNLSKPATDWVAIVIQSGIIINETGPRFDNH